MDSFQVKRGLNCYRLSEKLVEVNNNTGWKLYQAEKMNKELWNLAKNFWDYIPSWQNGKDAVCAVEDSFGYTFVESDGVLIGYGIVEKVTGDIAQLAVDCHYRRRGAATAILKDLQSQTQGSCLTVINNVWKPILIMKRNMVGNFCVWFKGTMSLDGYIADSKGSVNWLSGQGHDDDNIDAYSEFVKDIDTVIMGWCKHYSAVS